MMYTWSVTSSQVFRGPTPIRENNWRLSFRLATALPETAAGMGGSFFSSAPSPTAALRTRAMRNGNFFIAEILPHLTVLGSRVLRNNGENGQLSVMHFCSSVYQAGRPVQ